MSSKRPRTNDDHYHGHPGPEEAFFDFSYKTNQYKRSQLKNVQTIILEPNQIMEFEENPRQLDFTVENVGNILMGLGTRFHITGNFEMKKAQQDGGEETRWVPVDQAENSKVLVQPGWLDFLIKSVEVYHGNTRVSTCEENGFITPHLNRFIESYQDKSVLELSSPGDHHPSRYYYPFERNKVEVGWDRWKEYSKTIFTPDLKVFEFVPRTWPFVQGVNHLDYTDKKNVCRALPIPTIGKLTIVVKFDEDPSCIFRKEDNNMTKYRFKIKKFRLVLQEALLQPTLEKRLLTKGGFLAWPGVARLTQVENIPAATTTYMCRFKEVQLPNGLLIFALNKNVANGTWKFSNTTSKNGFLKHNIIYVDVSFNQRSFSTKEPSIGDVDTDVLDQQRYFRHLTTPIFGLKPDLKQITMEVLKQGGENSSFPHVYIPLTVPHGDKSTRLTPTHDDGSSNGRPANLELFMKFGVYGSAADAVYVVIAFYDDITIIYDTRNRKFISPHNVIQN